MVSIQTNISVISNIKYSSSQVSSKTAGQIVNKKDASVNSATNATFLFGSQVKADALQNFNDQNAVFHFEQLSNDDKLKLFYNDTPISELSSEEAKELISEDGYFGITQTSQRIINFVVQGAGSITEIIV